MCCGLVMDILLSIMNKKCFGTDARKVVRQSFLVELELFSAATSQIYAARPEFVEMDGEVGYNHRKEREVGHEAISHRN